MEIEIKDSIINKRLIFTGHFFSYLYDLILPVFLGLLIAFLALEFIFNLNESNKDAIFNISIVLISVLAVEILAIRNLLRINNLKVIETNNNEKVNKVLTERIAEKLGWSVLSLRNEYIIFRNPFRIINPGENITILFDKNRILINSTCYPVRIRGRSLFSLGSNRRNIKKFESMINDIYAR